jgi:hypothetical protein
MVFELETTTRGDLKMIDADASERIRGQLRILGSTAPFGQVLPDNMELMLSTQEWRELGLMNQLLKPFYNFTLKFNRTQECPFEALTTFFYLEEFLRDMGEASTPSALAAFFARHGIKACTTKLSEELRNAAHATCSKLTKYFERADLMDFMYLANLMDPRFKDNIILKNLGLHSTGIINLFQEKVVQIDGLLSRGQGEAEMEVDPIIRKDQRKFDRIVMKCITGENETKRVNSISFDSIETEWDAYMRSLRSLNAPCFETFSFWKMESDRSKIIESCSSCVRFFSNKYFMREIFPSRQKQDWVSQTQIISTEPPAIDVFFIQSYGVRERG